MRNYLFCSGCKKTIVTIFIKRETKSEREGEDKEVQRLRDRERGKNMDKMRVEREGGEKKVKRQRE